MTLSNLPLKNQNLFGGWALWRWRGESCGLGNAFLCMSAVTVCSATHACACMTYKQQNSHSAPKMRRCSISQLSRPKHPATSPCFTSAALPYNTAGATPSQGRPHHRAKTGLGFIKALCTQKPAQRSISIQNFEIPLAETLLLVHHQVLPRLLFLLLKILSGSTSERVSAGSPFPTRSPGCSISQC